MATRKSCPNVLSFGVIMAAQHAEAGKIRGQQLE